MLEDSSKNFTGISGDITDDVNFKICICPNGRKIPLQAFQGLLSIRQSIERRLSINQ